MTEDPAGGRVLVVTPSGSEWGADPEGSDGSAVRGGDASGDDGVEDGVGVDTEVDPADVDGGSDGSAGRPDSPEGESDARSGERSGFDRVCDPETVADGIADRLPVEVVLRDERTAGEYLAELGPTIDCVVVLGSDTGPLGSPADDVSVPAVVCERPVVDTGTAVPPAAISVAAVADRVRAVVREARNRSDLRDANARLTALSRYAGDITGCETVDDVLDRTVDAATDVLAFDYCVILLVEGDRLVPRASALPDPELSPCDVTDGIAGRTLASGEAEVVADMQSDPDAVVEHDDLHAILSVPIGSQGVLQVASKDRDAFDDRDKEFAEILSGFTREALARLQREVTLRAERDRFYAFYMAVPVPVLCVERRDGEPTVVDTNGAYEAVFAGSPTGQPLSAAAPTEAERDRYGAALSRGEVSRGSVVRQVDDREEAVTLTVIPASPPGGPDYAFGVYRTDGDGPDWGG